MSRGPRRREDSSESPRREAPSESRFAVGGRRPVTEAIRAGRVERVLVARGSRQTEGLRELLEEAGARGASVEPAEPSVLERLVAGEHQGVVALVWPPAELDDRSFARAEFDAEALVVVLDGITDPQNFGASARCAEAAGAAMLVVRRRRAAPLSAGALRASAGALLHLPVARVTNLARALDDLKDRAFHVVGLDHLAPTTIGAAVRPPGRLALVVGSEDQGMSRLVREACDETVSIPMAGRTASLNASAALAVALFCYARRGSAGEP